MQKCFCVIFSPKKYIMFAFGSEYFVHI